MEWAWSERLAGEMRKALLSEDWPGVAMTTAQVMQKLKDVQIPKRHNLGTPWVGAWERFQTQQSTEPFSKQR